MAARSETPSSSKTSKIIEFPHHYTARYCAMRGGKSIEGNLFFHAGNEKVALDKASEELEELSKYLRDVKIAQIYDDTAQDYLCLDESPFSSSNRNVKVSKRK